MSFTVRKVEDPRIYVRKNAKSDVLGISRAWDNIADIKKSLSRLEDNVDVAAPKSKQKSLKNVHMSEGKVLKTISKEKQHLGKVTRFQLYDGDLPKKNHGNLKGKKIRNDWSKILEISSIPKDYSRLDEVDRSKSYSTTQYKSSELEEGPKFLEKTAFKPKLLNEFIDDPETFKSSTMSTSKPDAKTVSTGSHLLPSNMPLSQPSDSSGSSSHGKMLPVNEAALQKIKEKVEKQKAAMQSKIQNEVVNNSMERQLHHNTDLVTKAFSNTECMPSLKLKRKVGSISASCPSYRGFNASIEPSMKKKGERKRFPTKNEKDVNHKVAVKSWQKKEKNTAKNKMTRIVGSKRPQAVITTTSWKDGRENVNKILKSRKIKSTMQPSEKTKKITLEKFDDRGKTTTNTYVSTNNKLARTLVTSSEDEIIEGPLTSSDDDHAVQRENENMDNVQAENDKATSVFNEETTTKNLDDFDVESKMKDSLSKDVKGMLVDLAKESSESDTDVTNEEKVEILKTSPQKKRMLKVKKIAMTEKSNEDMCPKAKTRHYDQVEVQRYMAHQLTERRKKMREEKLQKKKQEEEKQRRLKDLYERQRKSFISTKKEKRLGKTFSMGNIDVRFPRNEKYEDGNIAGYTKDDQRSLSLKHSDSDKENTEDVEDMKYSPNVSSERCVSNGDTDVTLTEELFTNESMHEKMPRDLVLPASTQSLDDRTQRLTALQSTALALQSRLQSHALRLSGMKEGSFTQQTEKQHLFPTLSKETAFQGELPGVAHIRRQAIENEKQSKRTAAATKIQAAYRGHTVRKRHRWNDERISLNESGNISPLPIVDDENVTNPEKNHSVSEPTEEIQKTKPGIQKYVVETPSVEDCSDDMQFKNLPSFHETDLTMQENPSIFERKHQYENPGYTFLHNEELSKTATRHYKFTSAVPYEPRGDRFSVMNIFTRRFRSLPVEDILNEGPGSETASLLEIDSSKHSDSEGPGSETASLLEIESRKKSDRNNEYVDDATDVDSFSACERRGKGDRKDVTYSECFETDSDTKEQIDKLDSSQELISSRIKNEDELSEDSVNEGEEMSSSCHGKRNQNENVHFTSPVLDSTMQPNTRTSPSITSLSGESPPIRRFPYFPKPSDHRGGDRLSPDSLQRQLTAEINLLENVEDSVRQVNDIEKSRAVSLAQQETVSLAQILKSKQQSHEQEMNKLRLKAKQEATQAAKDLEKTRQAAAMAAASAAESLALVQTQCIKTNSEQSKKYMEEATRMTSGLLTSTSQQLADFCKNLTSSTSAAVENLQKMKGSSTILVERATSISEGHHDMKSDKSLVSDEMSPACDDEMSINERTLTDDLRSFENDGAFYTSGRETRTSDQQTLSIDQRTHGNESREHESEPRAQGSDPRTQGSESRTYKSDMRQHTSKSTTDEVKSKRDSFVNSSHALTRYSSDEFDSYESIPEEIANKTLSENASVHKEDAIVHNESGEDTTVHNESGEDLKPRESMSSALEYSSQLDDSSRAVTDDDVEFSFLLPSREHRRKSMKRIKDQPLTDGNDSTKKEKCSPFESYDSFGRFTVNMIQRYMMEEEVRTKHQAAILRLREKSLKEKTKAELQWLDQLKKQSRDKGSDDTMPSIKKRERGIKMKLKKEKEEIKCLKAANRAASFQRHFMIYQQQEIERLHKATLTIRDRIQHNSPQLDQVFPAKTISPVSGPKRQSTPTSSSKSKNNETAISESISEEIDDVVSYVSPNSATSPFPSYGSDKIDFPRLPLPGEKDFPSLTEMLRSVNAVGEDGDRQSQELMKIYKMLLERQEKLAKDECEVNNVLKKVTQMLNNLNKQSNESPQHDNQSGSSEVGQSPTKTSENDQAMKISRNESIPEQLTGSTNEEIKTEPFYDEIANDYENATFEYEDITARPGLRSVNSQHIDEEMNSMTETSEPSEAETEKSLNELIEREKKKAKALERKKQKIKKLEIEIQNTRENIHRKLAQSKTTTVESIALTDIKESVAKIDATLSSEETTGNQQKLNCKSYEVHESLVEFIKDEPRRENVSEKSSVLTNEARDESHDVEESMVEEVQENNGDILSLGSDNNMRLSMTLRNTLNTSAKEIMKESSQTSLSQKKSPSHRETDAVTEEMMKSMASIPEDIAVVTQDHSSRNSEISEDVSENVYTSIEDENVISDYEVVQSKSSQQLESNHRSDYYDEDSFENSLQTSGKDASNSSSNCEDELNRESKRNVEEATKRIQNTCKLLDNDEKEVKEEEEKVSFSEHFTSSIEENISEHLSEEGSDKNSLTEDVMEFSRETSFSKENEDEERKIVGVFTHEKQTTNDEAYDKSITSLSTRSKDIEKYFENSSALNNDEFFDEHELEEVKNDVIVEYDSKPEKQLPQDEIFSHESTSSLRNVNNSCALNILAQDKTNSDELLQSFNDPTAPLHKNINFTVDDIQLLTKNSLLSRHSESDKSTSEVLSIAEEIPSACEDTDVVGDVKNQQSSISDYKKEGNSTTNQEESESIVVDYQGENEMNEDIEESHEVRFDESRHKETFSPFQEKLMPGFDKSSVDTTSITNGLLHDAIMQMLQIKYRKKTKMMQHADDDNQIESTREQRPIDKSSSDNEITVPTDLISKENKTRIEEADDEMKIIDNALMIAKNNQVLDNDALQSIHKDIAGLLGEDLDDEDELPEMVTNFSSENLSDNEPSTPDFLPMLAVPHTIQEVSPIVHSTVDILLEERRLGRPLNECMPPAHFWGENQDTENVILESYKDLVFDLTKEVLIDIVSQSEPTNEPPWSKSRWKGGKNLSRNFKRWKSDEEIRTIVLERVTNIIGLGVPRATMATIPRKTPVRGSKKDNVDAILIEELRQEEPLWTDYDEDETNVKFQVADAIFNMLLEDTSRVFSGIDVRKNVYNNNEEVLVV